MSGPGPGAITSLDIKSSFTLTLGDDQVSRQMEALTDTFLKLPIPEFPNGVAPLAKFFETLEIEPARLGPAFPALAAGLADSQALSARMLGSLARALGGYRSSSLHTLSLALSFTLDVWPKARLTPNLELRLFSDMFEDDLCAWAYNGSQRLVSRPGRGGVGTPWPWTLWINELQAEFNPRVEDLFASLSAIGRAV